MADGRHSVTHYETLEAHRFASLLEVHLETGRTHQIRVHMAALKHPCVGDLTYGADPTLATRVGLERQWLHAVRLGFEHPDTGEYVEYESTYPDDLAARPRGRSAMPTEAADAGPARLRPATDRRRRPTLAAIAGARRGVPRDAAAGARRRRTVRAWLAAPAGRAARGLGGRAGRRPRRATPGSTTTWLDDLYVAARRAPGTGVGSALLDLVKGAAPARLLPLGLRVRTPRARALLRSATAWSSSSAPTARPTRSRRPDSGWPGRARTRWRSTAA